MGVMVTVTVGSGWCVGVEEATIATTVLVTGGVTLTASVGVTRTTIGVAGAQADKAATIRISVRSQMAFGLIFMIADRTMRGCWLPCEAA